MIFPQAEHRGRRRLANPTRLARLALLAFAPVTFLWAVGAALPGPRADLAALTFAPSGAMPRFAAAEAVRLIDGVVLVAPAAGRFEPAVADGATVARGGAVASIEGLAAPALARAVVAAARALRDGALPAARRGLLTSRAAAASSLAAANISTISAPAAGTVRWRLPGAGEYAPAPGQWVTAGQPLGVVSPPASAWRLRVLGAAPTGLRPGARLRIAPLGLDARVTRIAGGTVDVTAGAAAANTATPGPAVPGPAAGSLTGSGSTPVGPTLPSSTPPDPAPPRPTVPSPTTSGATTSGATRSSPATSAPAAATAHGRPLAVTVAWGRASGALVPVGAVVRHGGAAWVLAAPRYAGRLHWVRVSVLAAASPSGPAVVAGLAPGAWVAARPWLAGLWAAWP